MKQRPIDMMITITVQVKIQYSLVKTDKVVHCAWISKERVIDLRTTSNQQLRVREAEELVKQLSN